MKRLLLAGVAACALGLGGCDGALMGLTRDTGPDAREVYHKKKAQEDAEWQAGAPAREAMAQQHRIEFERATTPEAMAKSGMFKCYHGTNGSWTSVRSEAECRDWQGRMNAAALRCLAADNSTGLLDVSECARWVTPPVINLPGRSYGR